MHGHRACVRVHNNGRFDHSGFELRTHGQAFAGSPRNADLKKELANNLHNSLGTVRCSSFWDPSPFKRLLDVC